MIRFNEEFHRDFERSYKDSRFEVQFRVSRFGQILTHLRPNIKIAFSSEWSSVGAITRLT